MRPSDCRILAFGLALLLLPHSAEAAKAQAKGSAATTTPPAADKVDVTDVLDKLQVLSDGHGHFLVVTPFGPHDHTYYGDGKVFFALRVGSASSSARESFNFTFWEPRVKDRYQASLQYQEGAYKLQCSDRLTAMTPLPKEESRALIAAASFYKPRWKHEAYALARDNRGTYYLVDHQREPEGNLVFRVFRGPRGKMKALKMTNVVSDSEGQIFATKSGDLRLVLDKKETSWVAGKANTKLVSLELFDNIILVYTDLGPYIGQRLGTPCDDL